jgi:eukaryotic-like serine/threonine-protein kinase
LMLEGQGVIRIFQTSGTWIAFEWAAGGSLKDHTRETLPQGWHVQLAAALSRIHRLGIVHNDIKPGNVLVHAMSSGTGAKRIVLADFGIARRIGEPAPLGSLGYMSERRTHLSASHPREDIFSFGKILEAYGSEHTRDLAMHCQSTNAPPDGQALSAMIENMNC